jgi:hypothetical protein
MKISSVKPRLLNASSRSFGLVKVETDNGPVQLGRGLRQIGLAASRQSKYDPFWYEELTHTEKLDDVAAIPQRTGVRVVVGEDLYARS